MPAGLVLEDPARHDDAANAADDFTTLKSAHSSGLEVVGAVDLTRSDTGEVKVEEAGGGVIGGGATRGATTATWTGSTKP